ncbi:hypothetical protein B0J13DRAFT_569284 [Dactylonectria estremocensis]|uniref:Uncharacterized protein n=1 Tax=Dactylonectria estremocensis TaxID=1079267 RepID=A0A9P9DIY9_9HYPO|nr:hypothetical protein B0J13DRAFT_569284 [Dactylonectria estremocensis]
MGIRHSQLVANHLRQSCERHSGEEYIAMSDLETPEFLHNLKLMLLDLTTLVLPEGLKSSFKPFLSLNASFDSKRCNVDPTCVKSPDAFLDLLPHGDNIAYRLLQGSSSKDQVVKRLCTLLFSWLRSEFNRQFDDKKQRFATYLGVKGRTCTDIAYRASPLLRLYRTSPILLLVTVQNNVSEYETHLPRNDIRLKDAFKQVKSSIDEESMISYHNLVDAVIQHVQIVYRQWLSRVVPIWEYQPDGNAKKKRKHSQKASQEESSEFCVYEHSDGQNPTIAQAPYELLPPFWPMAANPPPILPMVTYTIPTAPPFATSQPFINERLDITETASFINERLDITETARSAQSQPPGTQPQTDHGCDSSLFSDVDFFTASRPFLLSSVVQHGRHGLGRGDAYNP